MGKYMCKQEGGLQNLTNLLVHMVALRVLKTEPRKFAA